ncbi:hypothetical protein BABINDRAFT_129056 [Babjeviella inositovora NRRL Y-12698]|uniref:Uncharacterized protein n=1 Tax=Babjeviella inositovora NRRL Y-12698 TaxID=984486 RepID=A0A1E3QR68_9ASCO|nr:uncharacterized protein BABINDRAFT_129056 [Babjeviella inositovora NRRL Y-12698]ODQ80140.1 hypothetical protein BABINDRAFT_129056 [Babjeviella inositovora NRRL Y-12698]
MFVSITYIPPLIHGSTGRFEFNGFKVSGFEVCRFEVCRFGTPSLQLIRMHSIRPSPLAHPLKFTITDRGHNKVPQNTFCLGNLLLSRLYLELAGSLGEYLLENNSLERGKRTVLKANGSQS